MWSKRRRSLAACVVLVLVALAVVWVRETHQRGDSRHWQSGITSRSLDMLHGQGWRLQPVSASNAPVAAGAAVDHANAEDRIGGQLIRVTLAHVVPSDTSDNPRPGLAWVIEYDGVHVPPLAGTDTPGEHSGTEVVLVDAATGKTRFAITG